MVQNQEFKIDSPPLYLPFTYPLPPIYPPPKAHFDLTRPSFSGKIVVMRRFLGPFSDFSSAPAKFYKAGRMAAIVYRVARIFFKPSNSVKFRKVGRQAQDAPTLGTGGHESVGEGCGLADRHWADMYHWMGDETSNGALGQCRVGVIWKDLSGPFDDFLGSLAGSAPQAPACGRGQGAPGIVGLPIREAPRLQGGELHN